MVAGADGAGLLTGFGNRDLGFDNSGVPNPDRPVSNPEARIPNPTRYAAVNRVLVRVLVLNVAVAAAKIAFGYASGAISILSDGFHSLTDSASNVVGLVGAGA